MKRKKVVCGALFTACFLILCACADIVKEDSASAGETSAAPEAAEVVVNAQFQREDGGELSQTYIQILTGEYDRICALDENEQARLSGLPREGEATLTLLDAGQQPLGSMTLYFTTGAVVDASTDADGDGHIVLKEETRELALTFILYEDRSMVCVLRLSQ